MENTHVDFYIGTDPETMVWLGSCPDRGEMLPDFKIWWERQGVSPFILFPTSVHAYLEQVNRKVEDHHTRKAGWSWDYPDSRGSAWAYAYTDKGVMVSHYGSAWLNTRDLYTKEVDVEQRRLKAEPLPLVWPEAKADFPDLRDFKFTYPELVPFWHPVHTIVVTCSTTAVMALAELLRTLQVMGSVGSSRAVDMKDYGSVFFDGDGSDRIGTIMVNGIHLDDYLKEYLDVGSRGYRPSDYANDASSITGCCVEEAAGFTTAPSSEGK